MDNNVLQARGYIVITLGVFANRLLVTNLQVTEGFRQ